MYKTIAVCIEKATLLVCLLLFSSVVLAQTKANLHRMTPKWRLGDDKRVHTESRSQIFVKDSLFNNTVAVADYHLKVIDTSRNYTLLYFHEANSLDIQSNSSNQKLDSVVNFFTAITKRIEVETSSYKYQILVDKKTGLAIEVKNPDEYLALIETSTSSLIVELGAKLGKTDAQIDSIKQLVNAYIKLAEPKVLQTTINEFNYIMQAYSFSFPLNSSVSQKAMVHDVNALGEFGGVEMPAIITVSSKVGDNSLIVKTNTDYDKEFLLEQMRKKHKDMADLKPSDIFLSEKEETVFATKNSWIISQESNVVFEMKEVKVVNQTLIKFN
jgi:hypothetical protein